jgi:hypothetical protein
MEEQNGHVVFSDLQSSVIPSHFVIAYDKARYAISEMMQQQNRQELKTTN